MSAPRRHGGRPATDGARRTGFDDVPGRWRVPPLGGVWPTQWPPFLWAGVDEPPFEDPPGVPIDSIAGLYGLARTDPLEWGAGRFPVPTESGGGVYPGTIEPYRSVVWAGRSYLQQGGESRRVCYVPPGYDPAPFAAAEDPTSAGPQWNRGRLTLAVHPARIANPHPGVDGDFETLESPGPGTAFLLLQNSGYPTIAWVGGTRFWQPGGETYRPLTNVLPTNRVLLRPAVRVPPGLPSYAGEPGRFGQPAPEEPPTRRGE